LSPNTRKIVFSYSRCLQVLDEPADVEVEVSTMPA